MRVGFNVVVRRRRKNSFVGFDRPSGERRPGQASILAKAMNKMDCSS